MSFTRLPVAGADGLTLENVRELDRLLDALVRVRVIAFLDGLRDRDLDRREVREVDAHHRLGLDGLQIGRLHGDQRVVRAVTLLQRPCAGAERPVEALGLGRQPGALESRRQAHVVPHEADPSGTVAVCRRYQQAEDGGVKVEMVVPVEGEARVRSLVLALLPDFVARAQLPDHGMPVPAWRQPGKIVGQFSRRAQHQ